MTHKPDGSHLEKLQKILDSLFAQDPVTAGDFKSSKRGVDSPTYTERRYQGIYVFTDENDREIIYIGKTNDGTVEKAIADRIYGHLGGDSSISEVVSKDRRPNLKVRTLAENDPLMRGCAELYGIAVYRPTANRISRILAVIRPAKV